MARFGMDKKSAAELTREEQVAHKHVPGVAYEIADPSVKLAHMIGGGFFNEPKYYDPNRSYTDFAQELFTTGVISSRYVDEKGLTAQAKEVIEAAVAVANSANPEDLLVLAAWARDTKDGLKLRTTPQILLAVAAAHAKTQPFVRRYAPSIIKRADEILQVFAAFRHLFQNQVKPAFGTDVHTHPHRGSLPHSLRKGLAAAFRNFTTYDLLKYDGTQPSFKDVLLMIGGSQKVKNPVTKGVFEYFVNGKIAAGAPEMLAARAQILKLKDASEVSESLVRQAGMTWENLLSHFGNTKAVWELAIPQMGEMALVRNLRNFEQAEISDSAWNTVLAKIAQEAERTVMLPFRFWTASQYVTSTRAKTVLGKAMDVAVKNLPDLPGVTFALTDNSGSAVGCAISGKSDVRVSDTGNMLMAVLAKKLGERTIIGAFGDLYAPIPFNAADSTITIKSLIDAYAQTKPLDNTYLGIPEIRSRYGYGGGVGQHTETGLWFAIDDITRRKVKVDRIVLMSDLCCYTEGDVNCGVQMSTYFGKNATIQSMIDKYRREVNPDVYVYSINLNGHAQAQTRPSDKRSALWSGWSENLVKMMRDFEASIPVNPNAQAAENAEEIEFQTAPVYTPMDVIRQRFRLV